MVPPLSAVPIVRTVSPVLTSGKFSTFSVNAGLSDVLEEQLHAVQAKPVSAANKKAFKYTFFIIQITCFIKVLNTAVTCKHYNLKWRRINTLTIEEKIYKIFTLIFYYNTGVKIRPRQIVLRRLGCCFGEE